MLPESPIELPDPAWWLLAAGAVALALYNLGRFAHFLRLDRLMAWLARTLTAPITESVNTHLATVVALQVETQIDRVLYELRPNGGHSGHDRLAREIAEGMESLKERIDAHAAYSAEDRAALHEHDRVADRQISEIRAALERLETGETPPDDE